MPCADCGLSVSGLAPITISVSRYRIVAQTSDERKICMAEDIPGLDLAEETLRFLQRTTPLGGTEIQVENDDTP